MIFTFHNSGILLRYQVWRFYLTGFKTFHERSTCRCCYVLTVWITLPINYCYVMFINHWASGVCMISFDYIYSQLFLVYFSLRVCGNQNNHVDMQMWANQFCLIGVFLLSFHFIGNRRFIHEELLGLSWFMFFYVFILRFDIFTQTWIIASKPIEPHNPVVDNQIPDLK